MPSQRGKRLELAADPAPCLVLLLGERQLPRDLPVGAFSSPGSYRMARRALAASAVTTIYASSHAVFRLAAKLPVEAWVCG